MLSRLIPAPFRVLGAALTDWWDAWLPLMLINFAAAVGVALIVFAPPAIFGVYYIANQLAHARMIGPRDFIVGMRLYFVKSWLWAAANIGVGFLTVISLRFYSRFSVEVGSILQLLVLAVVTLWIIVQFYAVPYLIEQEQQRLLQAWRNGLFTVLASPIYTILTILLAVLIAAINIVLVLPLFIGGACIFALFATRAVFERLETLGIRAREARP